jgi:predicted metal-binding membrane protein
MATNSSDGSPGAVRNVMFGLVAVAAVAWIYLFAGAVTQMPMSDGDSMSMEPAWTWDYTATVLAMWAIIMVAMMLPVGAPDRPHP